MKPSSHFGSERWSQPWHALLRRVVLDSSPGVTGIGVTGMGAAGMGDGGARHQSWLERARNHSPPQLAQDLIRL